MPAALTVPAPRRRRPVRRRATAALALGAMATQTACYTYRPLVETMPEANGGRLAVVLNDQGRAALSGQLGSAVDRVDGTIAGVTGSSVALLVAQTTDLRGGTATWTGERVEIPRDGIRGFQERQFSRKRTFALVGAIAAVLVGSILGLNLELGGDPRSDTPPDGGNETR